MTALVRAHVYVSGVVQGVWFRAHTREAAVSIGVAGWVKNLPDGRVEAVFEGAPEAVRAAVGWCGRGPARARVDAVDVVDEPPRGLVGFEIRPG